MQHFTLVSFIDNSNPKLKSCSLWQLYGTVEIQQLVGYYCNFYTLKGCIGPPQCYHQEVSQEEPGLIVAAVFGFTANLFGVPQKQLQQYKTDLKSAATYPRS